MPEHVGMEEALELLKKPRIGNVMLTFKRAKYMPECLFYITKLYRVHCGQNYNST